MPMRGRLAALLRLPLVHFLLLGGLLFAAERAWLAQRPQPITVDTALVERLRAHWQRDTGHAPSKAQLQASLQRELDEQRLLREALRLGLERRDPVARERLLAHLRFALGGGGDEALLAEAGRLELAARDLVVRRRLVQVMEQRLFVAQLPAESELQDWVAQRGARYGLPARLRFEQRWFDPQRGDAATRAQAALSRLAAGHEQAGDPFLLGTRFDALSQAEIAARFGGHFAAAVAAAGPGAWRGPLTSAYGLHLVRVHERLAPQPPDYAAVRQRAAYAWLSEHAPLQLRQALAPLRRRYPAELAPDLAGTGLQG